MALRKAADVLVLAGLRRSQKKVASLEMVNAIKTHNVVARMSIGTISNALSVKIRAQWYAFHALSFQKIIAVSGTKPRIGKNLELYIAISCIPAPNAVSTIIDSAAIMQLRAIKANRFLECIIKKIKTEREKSDIHK